MSSKKRIMRSFKIHEISAVDKPAQEHARMTIMKRAPELDLKDEELVEKVAVLTASSLGHQHLIYDLENASGMTSHARKDGDKEDNYGHSHPYIIKEDGTIVLGEVDGHTHTIESYSKALDYKEESDGIFFKDDYAYIENEEDPSTWELRITKSAGGSPTSELVIASVDSLAKRLEHFKTPESLAAAISKLNRAWLLTNPDNELPTVIKLKEKTMSNTDPKIGEGEVALKAELAMAKAYGALTDVEKAFHSKLGTDAEKADFVNKSADQRAALIESASSADAVIYKSADGTEYRKSDDTRLVALAKQADEDRKIAKAAQDALETQRIEKRAETELANLPGSVTAKAAIIKSVEAIADAAVREEVMKSLKAGDAAVAATFTTNGVLGKTAEVGSAEEQLNQLANEYAKANNVEFAKAYNAVLETPAGAKLYEQTAQ